MANKIVSFVMLVPGALMQSMASFVAQNVGAGLEKRVKQAMVTGMFIGGSIGIPIALFSFFRGDLLAGICPDIYCASANVLFYEYTAGCESYHDRTGCAECNSVWDYD